MMDIKNLILTGLVTSYVFVLSFFTLFYHNPRYMLRMLPKDFAPHLETTTKKEMITYLKFMVTLLYSLSFICQEACIYATKIEMSAF